MTTKQYSIDDRITLRRFADLMGTAVSYLNDDELEFLVSYQEWRIEQLGRGDYIQVAGNLSMKSNWQEEQINRLRRDLETANARAAQAERRLATTAENYATLQAGFTGKPVSAADVLAFTDRLIELEDTVGHAGDYDIPPELRPLYPPLV